MELHTFNKHQKYFLAIFSLILICKNPLVDAQCVVNITVMPDYTYFVKDARCDAQTGTYIIDVYEDCPTNELIFNVTGDEVVISTCQGNIFTQDSQFGFTRGGNTEDPKFASLLCSPLLTSSVDEVVVESLGVFTIIDVNEFPPQPVGDLNLVQTLRPDENTEGSILDFAYQDLDAGEIQTMTISYAFDQTTADMFEIHENGIAGNAQTYSLFAKQNLDFETVSYYSMQVTFTSEDSRGFSSSTDQVFIVFVQDVGDNPPIYSSVVPYANFSEGPPLDVFTVQAKDGDVVVNNDIRYAIVEGNELDLFGINELTGVVSTITEVDREVLDSVIFFLTIEATEYLHDGTLAPEPNASNQTTTVRVDDVNDVIPLFARDYSYVNYDENSEIGFVVLIVQTFDPDENDRMTYSISRNHYLQIENPEVGQVSVKNVVDREKVDIFGVTITIKDLANHINSIYMNVTVNDLNDNDPNITCPEFADVIENSASGTYVTTISATDKDSGIHQDIHYYLKNYYYENEYKFPPFEVNSASGEITSMDTSDLHLDRESLSQWDLYISAYDGCDEADPKCTVRFDDCIMTVYVIDVNDNPPGDFQLSDNGDTIKTDEYLRQGESIPNLEISAFDPDEVGTPNSEIYFEVADLFKLNGEQTDQLFGAKNFNRSGSFFCSLYALDDLTGLQGDYIITIKASDYGLPQQYQEQNFTLQIADVNDMVPEISFSDCLTATRQIITLMENITELDKPLQCTPGDTQGNDASIFVFDKDLANTLNSKVDLVIDYASSIAENGGLQLEEFYIYQYSTNESEFTIAISAKLDREKGSYYNLSLVATDRGLPQQSSQSWAYIVIEDLNEYEPTFCDVSPCQQTLYIPENTKETTNFLIATDLDNLYFDVNDTNRIYYYIADDAVNAFEIANPAVAQINPIIDLDRESVGEFQFNIWTSNSEMIPTELQTPNQILQITVTILDQNDNEPYFSDIIYGDFTNTDNNGDTVAEMEFTDADLNDTLTYTIDEESLVWSDGSMYINPFRIESVTSRRSKLLLNMDPLGKTGYCTFTINCDDSAVPPHSSSAQAQVFVVTSDYIVPFYFLNDLQTVVDNSYNIEEIFTIVFGYTCVIDDISESVDANNNPIINKTVVYAHFIDEIAANGNAMTSFVISNDDLSSGGNKEVSLTQKELISKNLGRDISKNVKRSEPERDVKALGGPWRGVEALEGPERRVEALEGIKSLQEEKVNPTLKGLSVDSPKLKSRNSIKNDEINLKKTQTGFFGFISKLIGNKKQDSNINKTFTKDRKMQLKSSVTYQLVPKEDIEKMGTQGAITSQLNSELNAIGLHLVSIGEVTVDQQDNTQQQIVLLKIGLGIVALVLGLLVILLLIVHIGKTRKMRRQIKVLSTNTFGSKASGLNKIEADMSKIPGSNVYAKDITNPIWNNEVFISGADNDATSDSSGDSVFAGVEEEPAFKSYSPKNTYTFEQPGHYEAKQSEYPEFSLPGGEGRSYEKSLPQEIGSAGRVNPMIEQNIEPFNPAFFGENSLKDEGSSRSISNDDDDNSSFGDKCYSNFSFQ